MTLVTIIAFTFGAVGILFGIRCYVELWRWAKQCQRAQIAVAYKQRVKLSAPLVEWLLWVNQLRDADSNGRVVYRMGGTSVAIVKGATPPSRIRRALRTGTRRRKSTATPPVREGRWANREKEKVA